MVAELLESAFSLEQSVQIRLIEDRNEAEEEEEEEEEDKPYI